MPVKPLTMAEARELCTTLGLTASNEVVFVLSERVEISTLHLMAFLREQDEAKVAADEKDYTAALKRVAADPARSIGELPSTDGGRSALGLLMVAAKLKALDPETRTGAAAIGDLAADLVERRKPLRKGAVHTMGEDQLFSDILDTLLIIAPEAVDRLPSNETLENNSIPAIRFAEAFIQIVVDRTISRIPDAPPHVTTRILNKKDRRLLDGIRKARQHEKKMPSIL
ncbi:hypothetical protein [Breoghania sp.]|uniref:hypothetical protein n=1 Tax=Breoghania sp. TaxID=2065378 RepID=UPI0029CA0BA3|nr:hypothetical protein [Breoghania sp.]